MRFLVIGVGAVGGYLISKLALAGNTVEAIVSKRSSKRYIENEGIEYFTKDKKYKIKIPCYVYEDLKDVETDYLIVATKSREALNILEELSKRRFVFNYIVTVQNGVEVHLKASELFGEDHLILSVREGLYSFELHKVRNVSEGAIHNVLTSIRASRESVENFAEILNASGIPTVVSYDGLQTIYEKLVLNSIVNPLASILKVKNGFLLRMVNSSVVSNLLEEAIKVVALEGIHLNPNELLNNLKKVLQATYDNRCSMLQDLEQKKKTEIDFLNGYLIKLGKKHGMDLVAHQVIYDLVVKLEEVYGAH